MQNFCAIEVQLLVDWRIEAKLRKHNLFYLQRRNKIQTIINQRLEYMKFQWLVRSNIWRYGYSGVGRRSRNLHYCVKFSNSAMMSDTLWAHWLECPAEASSRVNRSCMGTYLVPTFGTQSPGTCKMAAASTTSLVKEVVIVDGLPTVVSKILPKKLNNKYVIVVIPGNPGLVEFYDDFVTTLFNSLRGQSPVYAISHVGRYWLTCLGCFTVYEWTINDFIDLAPHFIVLKIIIGIFPSSKKLKG